MGTKPNPERLPATVEQKLARVREMIAAEASQCERTMARGHHLVGKFVLSDPDLVAVVMPRLEPHLSKLGSGRAVVDNYAATKAKLEHLKSLTL
jgi:hypothetical protein